MGRVRRRTEQSDLVGGCSLTQWAGASGCGGYCRHPARGPDAPLPWGEEGESGPAGRGNPKPYTLNPTRWAEPGGGEMPSALLNP